MKSGHRRLKRDIIIIPGFVFGDGVWREGSESKTSYHKVLSKPKKKSKKKTVAFFFFTLRLVGRKLRRVPGARQNEKE